MQTRPWIELPFLWMLLLNILLGGGDLTNHPFKVTKTVYAQTSSYPACRKFGNLPEQDHYCTRIEGEHPQGCCPPLIEEPITCHYAKRSYSQPILANSFYYTCETDANGTKRNTPHRCCIKSKEYCYSDLRSVSFIPFLTYGWSESPKACCFAACPNAVYWSNHPDTSQQVPSNYKRLKNASIPTCQESIDRCDYGDVESCLESEYCPYIRRPRPTTPPPKAPEGG